jgi:hypothetical protein
LSYSEPCICIGARTKADRFRARLNSKALHRLDVGGQANSRSEITIQTLMELIACSRDQITN